MSSPDPTVEHPASGWAHQEPATSRPRRSIVPRAPRTLSADAKSIWHRLAPELHRAGLLGALDLETLAWYCDLAVQVGRARDMLEMGLLSRGRRDDLITSPAWRIYRDGLVLLRAYGTDLGLSPAARSHRPAVPPALPPG